MLHKINKTRKVCVQFMIYSVLKCTGITKNAVFERKQLFHIENNIIRKSIPLYNLKYKLHSTCLTCSPNFKAVEAYRLFKKKLNLDA